MRYGIPIFLAVLFCTFGCGEKVRESSRTPGAFQDANVDFAKVDFAGEDGPGKMAKEPGPGVDLPRKIKFTAEVRLIVGDISKGVGKIKELVKTHKGYVAQSEEGAEPGKIRQAMYKVRVPVAQFDLFREALLALGDVEKNATDSEDVTEKYYDLKRHIANKRANEEGLRKLLVSTADRPEKADFYLKLLDELSKLEDYIDRQESQLKVLENLTDLTTVTVNLRERQKYEREKAPEAEEKPALGQRIARTFKNSVGGLLAFGQGVVLVAVGLAPWAGVLAIVGLPAWALNRRRRSRLEKTAQIQPGTGEASEPTRGKAPKEKADPVGDGFPEQGPSGPTVP